MRGSAREVDLGQVEQLGAAAVMVEPIYRRHAPGEPLVALKARCFGGNRACASSCVDRAAASEARRRLRAGDLDVNDTSRASVISASNPARRQCLDSTLNYRCFHAWIRNLAAHEGAGEEVVVAGPFAHVVKIDVAVRIAREGPSATLLVQRLETQLIACILAS